MAAVAGIGGKAVSLIVRTPTQEVIPYSLSLPQAKELVADLGQEVATAENDAKQTRQ